MRPNFRRKGVILLNKYTSVKHSRANLLSQKKAQRLRAALKSTKGGGWRRLGDERPTQRYYMQGIVQCKKYLVRRRKQELVQGNIRIYSDC
jgi:hypothetical protein